MYNWINDLCIVIYEWKEWLNVIYQLCFQQLL